MGAGATVIRRGVEREALPQMSKLECALYLAERGFYVFPVQSNGKLPLISKFYERATRDPETIRGFWFNDPDRNIGISTTQFGDDKALIVIDVDVKSGKRGFESIMSLELDGKYFPETMQVTTPSGGVHMFYVADSARRQGVNVFGSGLDVRSHHGYVVAHGSTTEDGAYRLSRDVPLAKAPIWMVRDLSSPLERAGSVEIPENVDRDGAQAQAREYLKTAAISVQGAGGDDNLFRVIARCKDFGVAPLEIVELLQEDWNDRCVPPWSHEELVNKVHNVFRYGKQIVGVSAPEVVFKDLKRETPEGETLHPFDELNAEFSFVKTGAFILQETTDQEGKFLIQHLTQAEFHGWFANRKIQVGDKRPQALSKLWMEWAGRRQYENVVFAPERDPGPRFYNLWRGFVVDPAASSDGEAVRMFLDHVLNNVCAGDLVLYTWLIGWFADMMQNPWKKTRTAIVLRGVKGAGKNACLEIVGNLLGIHCFVADDERYLLGNFNAHLEYNLFFILDEASWAGDKKAEGRLKGLITGKHHNIERKGREVYRVANLSRIAIIGNETWLVPATEDERRFAVFDVGNARKGDKAYFDALFGAMEKGGYAQLLRYLLDFDLTGIDVNVAPNTSGLIKQKIASLRMELEWWHECLSMNMLAGSKNDDPFPDRIPLSRLYDTFVAWADARKIHTRRPGKNTFADSLRKVAPSYQNLKGSKTDPEGQIWSMRNPGIAKLREEWEKFIGGKYEWND